MTLRDFLLVLRLRWRIVWFTALFMLAVAAGVNMALPKLYRASVTVIVDVKGGDPLLGGQVQAPIVPGYLATQVGIVSSDRVMQKVIRALGLDSDERLISRWRDQLEGPSLFEVSGFLASLGKQAGGLLPVPENPDPGKEGESVSDFNLWLAQRLAKSLQVRPAREGNLIEIAILWDDARHAARIANAFAQAYIDTSLELRVDPAKSYVKWFEERNQALHRDLERAQARLSEYQRVNGVVASPSANLDIENTRLSELSSQLTALQGARAESASRERQAALKGESMTEVLQNPVVASLKGDLARLELQRAEKSRRFGENYPDIRRLDEQVAVARQRLDLEIGKVAASLGASNRINLQREAGCGRNWIRSARAPDPAA
ncbi:MAG: hypothetical protein KIT18_01800 [Burkholderiales bacterium]|nr:hypothetical protein [Burkholderiales bacterium]